MLRLPILAVFVALSGCGSNSTQHAPEQHVYTPDEGGLAILREGSMAYAPSSAPVVVHNAVHAGNALQRKPYRYGGGHAKVDDSGYDCSGAVSYVLIKAGLLESPLPSKAFRNWGEPGRGRWITVYAKSDHSFITVGGLRLDTGWVRDSDERGPRWKTWPRETSGYVMRHPRGL